VIIAIGLALLGYFLGAIAQSTSDRWRRKREHGIFIQLTGLPVGMALGVILSVWIGTSVAPQLHTEQIINPTVAADIGQGFSPEDSETVFLYGDKLWSVDGRGATVTFVQDMPQGEPFAQLITEGCQPGWWDIFVFCRRSERLVIHFPEGTWSSTTA
jgi:hypothetical protein